MKWVQFFKRDEPPTFLEASHRAQLRWKDSIDRLVVGITDWEEIPTTADLVASLNGLADTIEAEYTAAIAAAVTSLRKESHLTFGPFFADAVATSATEAFQAPFFTGATAVARSTMDIYIPRDGEVVGLTLIANANRTAGTATLELLVNGAQQNLDGGAVCRLDATNTRRHSVLVARGDGEDVSAGQRVSLQLVTSSYTPNGAGSDFTAWFTVRQQIP